MELRQIKYFRTVSELGSITSAAHELGISQPSLSKQIRTLEAQLDVILLVRDGRGVKLTPAGAELYERLVEIDDKLSEAISTVSRHGERSTTVSIGSTGLVGTAFLTDMAQAISRGWPDAEIRLVEGYSQQVAAWLQSGRLDIALLYGGKASQQVEEILTVEQDLYLIEKAGASDVTCADIGFATLAEHPLIAFDQPSRLRARFERAAEATGTSLIFRHAIDSFSVIKDMVRRGDGAIGLPYSAVAEEIAAGLMQARRIIGPHMQLDLKLVASRRSGLGREVYDICAILEDILSERCASGEWQGCRMSKS